MDKVDKRAEVDKVEKQERIYQIGLMLRRKRYHLYWDILEKIGVLKSLKPIHI